MSGLTDFFYQRDSDYCMAIAPSRSGTVGNNICGPGREVGRERPGFSSQRPLPSEELRFELANDVYFAPIPLKKWLKRMALGLLALIVVAVSLCLPQLRTELSSP